jgi:hypothetical protein
MPIHVADRPGDSLAATTATAVLELLLAVHPAQLTLTELAREIAQAEAGAADREIEGAVGELLGAGLAHRQGELVLASRAAVRCDQLLGG